MVNRPPTAPSPPVVRSQPIAATDWMRSLVMVLMVIEHASMAFDARHLSEDSAMYADAMTMALPTRLDPEVPPGQPAVRLPARITLSRGEHR